MELKEKIEGLIKEYEEEITDLWKYIEEGGEYYENQEPTRAQIEVLENVIRSLSELV